MLHKSLLLVAYARYGFAANQSTYLFPFVAHSRQGELCVAYSVQSVQFLLNAEECKLRRYLGRYATCSFKIGQLQHRRQFVRDFINRYINYRDDLVWMRRIAKPTIENANLLGEISLK